MSRRLRCSSSKPRGCGRRSSGCSITGFSSPRRVPIRPILRCGPGAPAQALQEYCQWSPHPYPRNFSGRVSLPGAGGRGGRPVQTNPIPFRILGFTRDEWDQALFDDPVDAAQFREFLEFLGVTVREGRGGLTGIGPEPILAIARVSPAFARRLRDHYESHDRQWRTTIPEYLELNCGPDAARLETVRSRWSAILALLDDSGSGS